MLPDKDKKLVDRLLQYYMDSATRSNDYRQKIGQHLGYFQGGTEGQWTQDAIKAARQTTPQKPLITVNQIFKFLNMMSGVERQNRQDARVFPVGRGSDPLVADILNLAVKNIDYLTGAVYKRSDLYLHAQIADRAHIRWNLRYNKMWPVIEMEALDPRDVFEDPEGQSYDFDRHRFVCVSKWMWEDELIAKYASDDAEAKHIKESFTTSPFWGDDRFFRSVGGYTDRKLVNILEFQYRDFKKFAWAFHPTERKIIDKVDSPNEMKTLTEQGFIVHVDAQPVSYIARISGDLLLENMPHYLPNGWFDISRYSPYFAMGTDVSMVGQLISQQDEINANRTAARELVARMPKGTVLYTDQSGLSSTDVENISMVGGAYKVTDLSQIKVLDTSNYANALNAFIALAQMAEKEFQTITGISDVLLGQLKSSTSGIVFNAARQQAVIGLQTGLDNFQRTLKAHYRKLIPIIQLAFPADKLLRLSDDQYPALEKELGGQAQFQNAAFAVYSPPDVEFLNQYREVIHKITVDMTLGEFDVVMDFGASAVTNMQANLMLALQIVNNVPNVAPFILDLITDMSGFPQKKIWTERIRKAMPILQDQLQNTAAANIMEKMSKAAVNQRAAQEPIVPPENEAGLV